MRVPEEDEPEAPDFEDWLPPNRPPDDRPRLPELPCVLPEDWLPPNRPPEEGLLFILPELCVPEGLPKRPDAFPDPP